MPGKTGKRARSGSLSQSSSPSPDDRVSDHPGRQPRKGFKKSRGGCYTCKRRKIKCPENRPSCHNCTKIQAPCSWPSDGDHHGNATDPPPQPGQIVHMQSTPTIFTMTDMRLFHHFLFNCYPHLPLGNEKIWQTEIASYVHHYEFLIHAVLALAASHLTLASSSNFNLQALHHRVLAIEGLNKSFASPPKSKSEADAMLATCYALSIQASYIGDSIEEWLTMLRGSQLIMAQGWTDQPGSSFNIVDLELLAGQARKAYSQPGSVRNFKEEDILALRSSLEAIAPLCRTSVEKMFHDWMSGVVDIPNISSLEIYVSLCKMLAEMPNKDFSQLIDATNPVMQILLGQFIAIQNLMYALKKGEPFMFNGRFLGIPDRSAIFRIQSVLSNVPSNLHGYLEWPKERFSDV